MARTFLTLVNDVLTRLRETAVVTNAASSYSTMVGAFINDAKREVEDAWQWTQLYDYFQLTTTQGTYEYETDGLTTRSGRTLGERTRLWVDPIEGKPLMLNTTKGYEGQLTYEPNIYDAVSKQYIINNNTQDIPGIWQIYQSPTTDTAGLWNKSVHLYNIPNGAYTLRCYVVNPQEDLASDGDVLLIPYAPVVQKAYLYCLWERGEELGEAITLTQQKVEDVLSNAIAQDQALSSHYFQMMIPYGGKY